MIKPPCQKGWRGCLFAKHLRAGSSTQAQARAESFEQTKRKTRSEGGGPHERVMLGLGELSSETVAKAERRPVSTEAPNRPALDSPQKQVGAFFVRNQPATGLRPA